MLRAADRASRYTVPAFRIMVLAFAVAVLGALGRYIFESLPIWHFLEPAENENAFLISVLQHGGAFPFPPLSSLIETNGLLPIYPPLYHQLAALLPLPPLVAGRLLSVSMFSSFIAFLYLTAKKWTDSRSVAVLISLLPLGVGLQLSYFLMCRIDGAYLGAGFVGTLLPLMYVWCPKNQRVSYFVAMIGSLATLLAVLSKQTGVIFILLNSVTLGVAAGSSLSKLSWLKHLLLFWGVFAAGLAVYALFLDRELWLQYHLGLSLYASRYNLDALRGHIQFLVLHYWYCLLAGALAVANIFWWLWRVRPLFSETLRRLLFSTVVVGLFIILSLKLWGNDAAFSNNFIFILTATSLILLIWWQNFANLTKGALLILLLVGQAGALFFGQETSILGLNQRLHQSRTASPIFKRLSEMPAGEILTSRADYFAFSTRQTPVFEASVLMAPFSERKGALSGWPEIEKAAESRIETIRTKINHRDLNGIVLGIQSNLLLQIFPEISQQYVKVEDETQSNGAFQVHFELLVPKTL